MCANTKPIVRLLAGEPLAQERGMGLCGADLLALLSLLIVVGVGDLL